MEFQTTLKKFDGNTFKSTLRSPTNKYTKFLSRDVILARYILCDSPVLVRLSVQAVRDRGTGRRQVVQRDPRRDVIGPSTRPIATDEQLSFCSARHAYER